MTYGFEDSSVQPVPIEEKGDRKAMAIILGESKASEVTKFHVMSQRMAAAGEALLLFDGLI